jgi:hypothetical protein
VAQSRGGPSRSSALQRGRGGSKRAAASLRVALAPAGPGWPARRRQAAGRGRNRRRALAGRQATSGSRARPAAAGARGSVGSACRPPSSGARRVPTTLAIASTQSHCEDQPVPSSWSATRRRSVLASQGRRRPPVDLALKTMPRDKNRRRRSRARDRQRVEPMSRARGSRTRRRQEVRAGKSRCGRPRSLGAGVEVALGLPVFGVTIAAEVVRRPPDMEGALPSFPPSRPERPAALGASNAAAARRSAEAHGPSPRELAQAP